MDFGLSDDDLKIITSLFFKFSQIKEAIMFGSRAMGNYKKGSDVDIALKGQIDFALLSKINFSLNEDLALPYIFDVVDYEKIENVNFIKHIDQHGKSFYSIRKV